MRNAGFGDASKIPEYVESIYQRCNSARRAIVRAEQEDGLAKYENACRKAHRIAERTNEIYDAALKIAS